MSKTKTPSADTFDRLCELFEQYHKEQDARDIATCPNANPEKGICPAARDTFLRMIAEWKADCWNVTEKQKPAFIEDYMKHGKLGYMPEIKED